MPIKELLSPEAETLLITFAKEICAKTNRDGLATAYTGALLATRAGIIPKHSEYRPDYCTEQDCIKARHAIMQLLAQNFIVMIIGTLHSDDPRLEPPRNGKDLYWPWLRDTSFSLTEKGFLYAEWLQSPWNRKLKGYFKEHAWSIIAAIVGILILILTVLQIMHIL